MSTRKALTEAAWLACDSATSLLKHLQQHCFIAKAPGGRRRLRLFCCACCRRAWRFLDKEARHYIEVCELAADGLAGPKQLTETCRWATDAAAKGRQPDLRVVNSRFEAVGAIAHASSPRIGVAAAELVTLQIHLAVAYEEGTRFGRQPGEFNDQDLERWHDAVRRESRVQCDLARDIFHNPFRPIDGLSVINRCMGTAVERLALAIYADRAFDRLPILADALEEAGCTAADILAHCRGPGPHVRGCWVVDLILGKE